MNVELKIEVSDDAYNRLEQQAEAEGRSVSEIASGLVNRSVSESPSPRMPPPPPDDGSVMDIEELIEYIEKYVPPKFGPHRPDRETVAEYLDKRYG